MRGVYRCVCNVEDGVVINLSFKRNFKASVTS